MDLQENSIIELQIASRPATVGEMVVADYRKAEVFRKFGIDYCCGGKKPLEEVCLKKGVDPNLVRQELEKLDQAPTEVEQTFQDWDLDKLTDHIVGKHHQYVAESLPILYELSTKVARVHGERHPELLDIARRFAEIAQELQMHMMKEEKVLFPYINQMAKAHRLGFPIPSPAFGSVSNPIQMMESEHEAAGSGMEDIRQWSHHYTPPLDACTSYRVLFAKLSEFEQDLHQHVHLENNLLFPKAIALEKA